MAAALIRGPDQGVAGVRGQRGRQLHPTAQQFFLHHLGLLAHRFRCHTDDPRQRPTPVTIARQVRQIGHLPGRCGPAREGGAAETGIGGQHLGQLLHLLLRHRGRGHVVLVLVSQVPAAAGQVFELAQGTRPVGIDAVHVYHPIADEPDLQTGAPPLDPGHGLDQPLPQTRLSHVSDRG
ncbi:MULTISPECIES: hypothetical protein [Actinosynnema]|uniref:hypothetical protein n=1 Tax=Actinosynnema TaxID=40566 RepID=UPI0020A5FBD2|nr:hypothetical protein [Actinosynnema pretiosum]